MSEHTNLHDMPNPNLYGGAAAPTIANNGTTVAPLSLTSSVDLSVERDTENNDSEEDEDSWEEYDDEPIVFHRGGKPRADRRKLIDNTTPTLEDEDRHIHPHQERYGQFLEHLPQRSQEEEDEEEEIKMISLERQRITLANLNVTSTKSAPVKPSVISSPLSESTAHCIHPDDSARSLRRTPGAIQMHESSRTELLGFGLALTTPLACASGDLRKDLRNLGSRPPRDSLETSVALGDNNKREDLSYTPASYALTKNPHIQVSHGAFSPNTLRLTEDLDNLLDEEDDELRHQIYRGSNETESWTKQYIFESEGGIAELTRMGKKNRRTSGRRSRGSNEYPREYNPRQDPQQHLTHDHHQTYQERGTDSSHMNEDDNPQPLIFGGAFAPPSDRGLCQRPVPSSALNDTIAFSSYSKPIVLQDQDFNPLPGNPHSQVHHNLQIHYPSAAPSPLFNHPFASLGGLHPLGYHEGSPRMSSSFVPPNHYMYSHQHQEQPSELQHIGGWAPIMIPPNNNGNVYANHFSHINSSSYGNHLPHPSPAVFVPPQQRHSAWGNDQAQGMDAPWIENTGYGLQSVPSGLTPVNHFFPQTQHQPQPESAYWQDVQSVGYESRFSPVVTLAPSPSILETSNLVMDHRDGSCQESAKSSRKDTRAVFKRHEKKDIKAGATSAKIDGQLSRSKKKTASSLVAVAPQGDVKTAPKGPINLNPIPSKCSVVKAQKTDDEIEDPAEAKRAELVESPETRAAFKDFYRNFRLIEKTSIQDAEKYALNVLKSGIIPDKTHWRIYLELADLAKRSNKFEDARKLYAHVCELQPYASQGWLESSKLEEEYGCLSKCSKILNEGLKYCVISENLLNRAIKHEEKMNNLSRARELLARLKHFGIEKVWRTVLEGALLEGRVGNHALARRVLKYLMHHIPWYGPLYLEAYRLERDLGRPEEALTIVERGLKAIPRYGPLWFGAFRLCEALDFEDNAHHLPRTTRMLELAVGSISRELVWKVHLDAAQILERAALASVSDASGESLDIVFGACRKKIAMTALGCPANLSWKVWLAGGRMELSMGNTDIARLLFLRAHKAVPEKGRVATLLECARLEEFAGDVDLARALLCKCRQEYSADWKVWLESVLLEIRDGNQCNALLLAEQAIKSHSGTGRLWASLVQLRYSDGGEEAQFKSLKCALQSVPKSGEVWCEGGRVYLNPFSKMFSLSEAKRHLFFAARFTPQYGDGFLETVRLEMIERWLLPIASCVWEAILPLFHFQIENYDGWISSLVLASVKLMKIALSGKASKEFGEDLIDKSVIPSLRAQLETVNVAEILQTSNLELRCANADPNYGSMWFHCRNAPTDTARVILRRARGEIVADLKTHCDAYVAAIIRSCGIIVAAYQQVDVKMNAGLRAVNVKMKEIALITPSIETIMQSNKTENPENPVLLESSASGYMFTSGLVVLSRHKPLLKMSLLQRKKVLFGSDALFS